MTNTQQKLNYGIVQFDFYPREKVSTSYFSKYRRFFRGTKWELMALPIDYNRSDLQKLENEIKTNYEKMLSVPAVYELAVCTGYSKKKYKVYVGKAVDMKQRAKQYSDHINNGSGDNVHWHINYALQSKGGLFLLRRIRYIIPKEHLASPEAKMKANLMAHMWEQRILGKYNYAWNYDANGPVVGAGVGINHTRRAKFHATCNCLFPRVKFEYVDPNAKTLYKIAKL
jgi:hypothetical protein